MSLPLTVEGKSQAKNEAMAQHKCRIPQRLPPGRQRTPLKLRSNVDNKNKPDVVSLHQRCNIKNITYRPRSNESDPKSVNKSNDDNIETIPKTRVLSRSCRQERLLPAVKVVIDFGMFHIGSDRLRYHVQDIVCQKPFPSVYKKVTNEKMIDTPNKMGRQIITVPLKQKMVLSKATCQRSKLPDQETIKKQEDLELQQEDSSDAGQLYNDMKNLFLDSNEEDSITSRSDRVAILKNNWHERIIQFQEMKDDLYARQKSILEVYASLRYTKDSLHALGQPVGLPPADGLRIMNVDHMTPAQLLQLCAGTPHSTDEIDTVSTKALKVDINKLSEMPMKLVAICEQTLVRRKEFIDWFQSFLNNSEKEYSKQKLIKKVNEFKEENKMVDSNLQYSKNKFIKDTTDHLRMYWNETIRLQLQNEELTFHLSELDSENKDLKKKISNCEQQRSYSNKLRIEELEKDLKEENIKKITIKDRLSRAEGQIKIGEERSAQLEGTLNQSQKQTRTLERTIQQLQDKNQLLQKNFDEELNKLKESMLRNTSHLEEIATAREALQSEKEDLKKKLEELSNEYNESINNLKQELNKNVSVLVEVEKKYNDAVDEKIMLQKTIESQCAHYEESESRYKETLQQLQEMEATLNKTLIFKEQLETITHDLNKNNFDLAKYKNRVLEQNKIIKEIEYKYNKSQEYGENLKGELNKKAEHVTALEKSKNVLEKQLQESEYKMQTYENQLCTLREEITNLQEHFGEFQNLNDLHELVNQESGNLVVVKQEFDKITEDINRKRNESDRLDETLAEQEDLIKQRNHILELLSEKEEEKTEIINFSQEIEEKNTEINSLVTNIETRKKQISQLEKIILTLEDQNRKATVQKRKDHEIICALEKKVAEYANYIEDKLNRGANSENLDNLIKILEDEMEAPFASQHESYSNYRGTQTLDYHHNSVHHKRFNNGHHSIYQQNNENTPTKIVLGNFVKKTYNIPNDTKYKSDLDRKQAITNIDAQKWIAPPNTEPLMNTLDDNNLFYINAEDQVTRPTERYLKNLQYFVPSQSRIEKKSKMFKLAGHRLN